MITVIINYSLSLSLSNCLLDGSSTYYLILFSINSIYPYNVILYWDNINNNILFIRTYRHKHR